MKIAILFTVLAILLLAGCQPQAGSTTTQAATTAEAPTTTSAPVTRATTTTAATTTMATTTVAPTSDIVLINDLTVQPDMLEVTAGSEVLFKVSGTRPQKLIISLDKLTVAQSDRLEDGDAYTYVFEEAGTYEWRSVFSGAVRGTVVVS